MKKRLLAFSSSKVANGGYLEAAAPVIAKFLDDAPMNIAFIPFASVDQDHSAYGDKVRMGLAGSAHTFEVVNEENAKIIIATADAIMVGGGNTFKLLHDLYAFDLMDLIREKVNAGTAYIGWSAGSNIAGATICTSNDMPIINPGSFKALEFLPFQINPHYYNLPVVGFNGETRNQRLAEYLQLNPTMPVVALPEGTALLLEGERLLLTGTNNAILFRWKNNSFAQQEMTTNDDLSFLM